MGAAALNHLDRNEKGQFVRRTTGPTFEGHGVWIDKKGYPSIWLNGRIVKVHVVVWERANGPKPKGTEIHHKDEDKANYALANLELLTNSEHQRIHAGWLRDENGNWTAKPCTRCAQVLPLSAFYPVKTRNRPSALCRACTNVVTAEHNKAVPEKRRLYNQRWYQKSKARRGGDAK